jgi:Uma2 family endonuclease
MTFEEFNRLPEGPPYYDYVNGEAVEVNRPSMRHQDILVCLTFALRQHARSNGLGVVGADVDVQLPSGNVFGPDIVFLNKEHLNYLDAEKGDVYGAPDLIVEVLSPSTAAYDRFEKLAHYHRAQVPWVWFIDQETLLPEELEWKPEGYLVTVRAENGPVFRPKLFPGLEINLKALLGEA